MKKNRLIVFVVLTLVLSLVSISFAMDQRTIVQIQKSGLKSFSSAECTSKSCDAIIEAVKALQKAQKAQGLPVTDLSNAKTCKAVADALSQK